MRSLGRVGASAVALFSIVVVAGWLIGTDVLASVLPGATPMRPSTAIACALLAAGVFFYPRRLVMLTTGATIVLVGITTLAEWATGLSLSLDVFLPGTDVQGLTARMPSTTAIALVLLGTAVAAHAAARESKIQRVVQPLVITSVIMSLMAVIGYLYGAPVLYTLGGSTGMALPSAVCIAVLSLCVLSLRPTEGLIGLLRDTGSAGRLLRPIVPAMIIGPFILGFLLLWGQSRGEFTAAFGVAALVIVMTLLGCALGWRASLRLRELDRVREHAAERLQQTNDQLEVLVTNRTQELEASAAQLQALIRLAPVGIMQFDIHGEVVSTNEQWTLLSGLTAAETQRLGWSVVVHPDDRDRVDTEWQAHFRAQHGFDATLRLRRPDGQISWVHMNTAFVMDGAEMTGALSALTDVTLLRAAEQSADAAQGLFEAAFTSSPFGSAIVRADGFLVAVNERFVELAGLTTASLSDQSIEDIFIPLGDGGGVAPITEPSSSPNAPRRMDRLIRRSDGLQTWVTVGVAEIRSSTTAGSLLYQLEDISARRRAEERVEHLAFHDPLTHLPNRLLLIDRLRQALLLAARQGTGVGVLFLDLDGFKLINDTLGHAAGDAVLIDVANRIQANSRATDTVSRMGGDEFVLVCAGVSNSADVLRIADTVQNAIAQPMLIGGQTISVCASVGIAFGVGHDEPETLLQNADQAMYQAKKSGKARSQVFDDDLRGRIERRYDTETALRTAVERGQIETWYQPIVNLKTLDLVATEALARWRRPEMGLILPVHFISVAEETGLIKNIGGEVLRQACQAAAEIPDGPCVSVNVSPRQFSRDDFGDVVRDAVHHSGLPASRLWLELTESCIIDATVSTVRMFDSLREMGVHLAIDDFGTGYSSFAHLRALTVDSLKIDMSFIAELEHSAKDCAVVEGIVRLADALELSVVAEGITTTFQREFLLSLGCRYGQGALFSLPSPAISDYVASGPSGAPIDVY